MLNMNNFIEIEGSHALSGKETILSLEKNWDIFRPYLEDAKVVSSLRSCLDIKSTDEWDRVEDAPWTYTRSDYWDSKILNHMKLDNVFLTEKKFLFDSMIRLLKEKKANWYIDDLYGTDAYLELESCYYRKYQPQEGEIDWYRWMHGCFFITPFVATLLQATIKDVEGIFILTSDKHSVAGFIKDKVVYYADLLIEWNSVEDLRVFMGKVTKVTLLAIN